MKNQISAVLSDEVYESINEHLEQIEKAMPFLINIAKENRHGGFRLGDKNLGFLEKSKDYLEQNPEFLPSYISTNEFKKDAVLTRQLTSIQRILQILSDKIDDTANIAGMEALSASLAYYNGVKQGAKNNVEGAQTIYEDLKARFPGGSKLNKAES